MTKILNPNLELLFKGPKLRTFNFNFRLRPRYDDESRMCKDIIRAFKRNMHPQRSSGELFLTTPNIFKINYYFNDGNEHPFMNRLKPCALTNFKVNYTPDNSYMTYDDGGMTWGNPEAVVLYFDEHFIAPNIEGYYLDPETHQLKLAHLKHQFGQ